MDELQLHLMDTDIYIAVPPSDIKWKPQVESWLRYVATEFSRFHDNNELSTLNQLQVGQSLQLSEALYDCLQKAQTYYKMTNGLFSPYLKKQMEQHGYNNTLTQVKAFHQPKTSLSSPTTHAEPFQFLSDHMVMKQAEVEVDLGGIAKGYAVDQTVAMLQSLGLTDYGIVDAGGDIRTWSAGEKEWHIGVADPYGSGQDMTTIKMKNSAIATSNRLYRCWVQNSIPKHHILNGQTGEVARTPVVQASFVASSACDAEVGTKLCFLLQEHKHEGVFQTFPGNTARFIVKEDETSGWNITKGVTTDVN